MDTGSHRDTGEIDEWMLIKTMEEGNLMKVALTPSFIDIAPENQ